MSIIWSHIFWVVIIGSLIILEMFFVDSLHVEKWEIPVIKSLNAG